MIGFRYTRITPLWLTCHGNLTFLMPIKVALLLLMKQLVKMWRWRNKQEISGYREYFKDDQYLGTEMFGIVTSSRCCVGHWYRIREKLILES